MTVAVSCWIWLSKWAVKTRIRASHELPASLNFLRMSDISAEVALAGVGVAISVGGLVVAGWAAYTAHEARRAAERSATAAENSSAAAERSANAAEESVQTSKEALELQRRAAEGEAEERHRRQLADVVPLKWESRNNQASGAGLVVTNRGPGVASDVRGNV